MTPRSTLFLAIAAVALAGGALWISDSRRPQQEASLQQAAVPGLSARLGDVDKVVIRGAGDAVLATLERGEQHWRLVERDYPADAATLRSLLLNLAEARRVAAKTAKPELYERLGVEDVSAADAQGVKLEISGGGEPLAVILGQNVPTGSGTYLRLANEAQSWQIDKNVAVEKTTANWLQKDLADIQPNRIQGVSVSFGKDIVEIVANDSADGDFILANLPRGREPQSDFVADATAGFLQGLRIDDVATAEAQPVVEPQRNAVFRTKDGLDITVSSWTASDKAWAQFAVSLDEVRAAAAIEAEQAKAKAEWEAREAAANAAKPAAAEAPAADGETAGDAAAAAAAADAPAADTAELAPEKPAAVADPAAYRESRLAELRKEVDTLSARFAGRSFALPSYKSGNLNRELEAYLKPKG
jgi:hypothetical protein